MWNSSDCRRAFDRLVEFCTRQRFVPPRMRNNTFSKAPFREPEVRTSLNFDIDEKEEIWLLLRIEVILKDDSTELHEREILFRPVRVKMYAPMV